MRRNGTTAGACRAWRSLPGPALILAALLSLLALSDVRGDDCDNYELRYGYECILNPGQSNNITIWCPWADNKVYLEAFINATRLVLLKSPEFSFVITVKSWAATAEHKSYGEELANALKEGTGTPTIVVVGTTWLSHFIKSNAVLDLTDRAMGWEYLSGSGAYSPLASVERLWSRKETPAATAKWYAVPIATDTNVLAYNIQAFQEANLAFPGEEVTWDYLFQTIKKLGYNSETQKFGYGIQEENEYSTRILVPYLYNTTETGIIDKESMKCALNNKKTKAALATFVEMWDPKFTVARPPIDCYNSSQDISLADLTKPQGGVSMLIVPPNKVHTVPNTTVRITALPKSFLGGAALAINQDATLSTTRTFAWELIRTLVETFLNDIAMDTFSPPPINSVLTGPNYAPWNQSGTIYSASRKGVLSGIDILVPNTDLPYLFNMEQKHLFRCLLDDIVNKGQSIDTAVSTLCDSVNKIIDDYCPLKDENCHKKEKSDSKLVVGLAVGLSLFAALVVAIATFIVLRRYKSRVEKHPMFESIEHTKAISRRELTSATDNFNSENLLGKGGFGSVYKGVMPNGKVVAVKLLIDNSQGAEEFLNEIEIISNIHHRNLVSVEGFCLEKDNMMLVYDYMPNGSLEDTIFGSRKRDLTWVQTWNILLGTANGINYLHTGCVQRIIHRDIKPANILLDEQLVARVSDFGMAKNTSLENTHVSTRIMGTLGYLDPNYSFSGQLTEKSDVYSFGVVMLVTLLGRRPFDPESVEPDRPSSKVPLVEWVRFVRDKAMDKVRQRFPNDLSEEEATRCILTIILCIQSFPDARPTMAQVLQMLTGDMSIPTLPVRDFQEDSYIPDYESASNSHSRKSTTASDFMLGSTIATSSNYSPLSETFSGLTSGR